MFYLLIESAQCMVVDYLKKGLVNLQDFVVAVGQAIPIDSFRNITDNVLPFLFLLFELSMSLWYTIE